MMKVYSKLAKARVELQNTDLKKSGHNKFAGFKYYELGDFLPHINRIFNELGLVSIFNLNNEVATLTILDSETESSVVFESPTEELVQKGMQPIQALGSKHTYLKRYLYLNALEIVEHDIVDSLDNKDAHTQQKAPTKNQVDNKKYQDLVVKLFETMVSEHGGNEQVYKLMKTTRAEYIDSYTKNPKKLLETMQEYA